MFGYATDETESLMPLTHNLATSLGARLTEVRKNGICPWVRPDGKTQVTVEYRLENGRPVPNRVHTIVISTQHSEEITQEEIQVLPPVQLHKSNHMNNFFFQICSRNNC